MISRYVYVNSIGRFRDTTTGRFVSNAFIMEVIEEQIKASNSDLYGMLSSILSGSNIATLSDVEKAFVIQLRNLHIQMLSLGSGGRVNVTASQWGSLGAMLRQEYRYMRGFLQEIAEGKLTDKAIRQRLNMYSNHIYNSYWRARTDKMRNEGFTEERRVLSLVENCQDCVDLAAKGWQPIGSLPDPADGSTKCLTNDRCIKEYR